MSPGAASQAEFTTFRNALFHDLTTAAPRTTYVHSRFSPRAEKCNQADLLEALTIALEIFSYYRYAFAGAALMPCVQRGPTVAKVDALVDQVIRPVFAQLLEHKGARSRVVPGQIDAIPAELAFVTQCLISTDGPQLKVHGTEPLIVDRFQAAASDRD